MTLSTMGIGWLLLVLVSLPDSFAEVTDLLLIGATDCPAEAVMGEMDISSPAKADLVEKKYVKFPTVFYFRQLFTELKRYLEYFQNNDAPCQVCI